MKLKELYLKPVNRPIEGVIKADDDSSILSEIEEYVLTNEVSQRLSSFLDAYNNYNSANGVWISGFFGSGKSHLLKILSILLENKKVEQKDVLDIFLQKCKDDNLLKAEIKKAVSIPSQSILFNIDQKADVISKSEIDALLSVFVKVFDETCGYYGKQGHIAKFERDLDSRGQYEKFKDLYFKHSTKNWVLGREQAILESANISKAYAEIMGGSPDDYRDILNKYRADYRVSIEDFANQVWDYIKSKQKNFRLNFFVDEVGQYIADNIKLMTNLQTIAESLATKCKGQAWVIVTAQEDMSNVIGEMDKQQGNDFSKIQARFSNRMKLTSQDVAEVIQKRLLTKKEESESTLEDIYDKYSNDFRTLFDFVDGSRSYINFKDKEHFVSCYPFVPYQFGLFQSAIETLSAHNAFEGRHSSVGERSMLGVFQEVAIKLNDADIGSLATFDLMFDGISSALKAQMQRSVLQANKNLSSEYALRILKTLFLVKYVKEFKPTLTNICILMHDKIDAKTSQIKTRVEEALNLLEQQTYIRRNGIYYEFLTDEEKDVEKEIKNTEVDPSAESEELTKIIFDEVIKELKIKYEGNGQYYKFARKLDDNLNGNRDYELTIHVISPFDDRFGNESLLRSHNMGRDELMVIMGSDDRLLRDLSLYLKTNKYIRQNTRIAQQSSVGRILQEKAEQNSQRRIEILSSVKRLLSNAKLMAHGVDIESSSNDPQTRIILGFQELIKRTYPQLKILKDIPYKEESISKYLNPSDSLLGSDLSNIEESETEVLSHISSQSKMGVRTTLKSVIDHFEKKPYGWYLAAIQCVVAKLNTRGKIECLIDSNVIEGAELEKAIRNTQTQQNLVLKPQQEFTASQIRNLKEFFDEFFDESTNANEPKALGAEVSEQIREKHHELEKLLSQKAEFSFLKVLQPAIDKLKSLTGKPYSFYIQELSSYESELMDLKESVIQPIMDFMKGEKKKIYQSAKEFVRDHEHDFGYINGQTSVELRAILDADDCFKGDKIKKAKELHDILLQKLNNSLKELRISKHELLDNLSYKLKSSPEYKSLSEPERAPYDSGFSSIKKKIEEIDSIPVLQSSCSQFESVEYIRLLEELQKSVKPSDKGKKAAPASEIIPASKVKFTYEKPLLSSEEDVNDYINKYKQALLGEIKSGKKGAGLMDTSKLKKFAAKSRQDLIEQVSAKLDYVLNTDSGELREKEKALAELKKKIQETSKDAVIERVAYTWFNRFCALRFMDVNGYTKIGIVTPTEGATQPEILLEAKQGHIDERFVDAAKAQRLFKILNGSLPSKNPQSEVYRAIIVAVCNYFHVAMPYLFERIEDYTELLMPDDLLSDNSVLADIRNAINHDDCKDVEVIGWLYQYYISAKKDKVFEDLKKKKKKITADNIPAATQLFTPHWIVRYLVENSLGRLWMLNYPNSSLKSKMEYYIEPEEAETDFLKISSPEELKVCDPACGSGHMLTYAFDLLYAIYEEQGYDANDIPEHILKKNLYGIEIDERAGSLAAFALSMKAREKSRRFLEKNIQPNICVLQNVNFADDELKPYIDELGRDLFSQPLINTIKQFSECDNFGSLVQPEVTDVKSAIEQLHAKNLDQNLFLQHIHQKVLLTLKQAAYLSPRYHVVVANPPYMGGGNMNPRLGVFAKDKYPDSKSDLFAMFIERNLELAVKNGNIAMITMQSWMFLSSFEKLRTKLLNKQTILSMAHLGARGFDSIGGEVVSTTAFVISNAHDEMLKGYYLRLVDGRSEKEKSEMFLDAILSSKRSA